MSFTYVLSTDIGKMRLKLSDSGDASPSGTATAGTYAFQDAELQAFLDEGGSVDKGVVLALRALLVDRARRERAFTLPGMTYDDKGAKDGILAALKLYGGELPTATVIMPATLPFDSGYVEQPVILTS